MTPPTPLVRLLQLVVLSAMAVGQPLLDVFGKNADTIVFRRADRLDLVLFALAVLLMPALLLWVVGLLAGRVRPLLGKVLHDAAMGSLWMLLALQLALRVPGLSTPLVVAVALAPALFAIVITAAGRLDSWFRYLSPAPVLFLLAFLVFSPAADVVSATEVSAKQVSVGRPGPIVMVVLDELPLGSLVGTDGRVDRQLFPGFAQLERETTAYLNTTSNAWATLAALPSLVTGKIQSAGTLPIAQSHPDSLFTLFGRSHELRVHELLALCPTTLCEGQEDVGLLRPGLPGLAVDAVTTYRRLIDPRHNDGTPQGALFGEAIAAMKSQSFEGLNGPGASRLPARFDGFLRDVARPVVDGRPPLDFLHILLPHAPWRLSPTGQRYTSSDDLYGLLDDEIWDSQGRPEQLARQRHLLQLQFTDSLIAKLVAQLKAAGTWDASTVVVTADHGVSFAPGEPRRDISPRSLRDLAWVPLFIKAPGQARGGVSMQPAQSVDVVPTVADLQGASLPWQADGQSLAHPMRSTVERRILGQEGVRFSVPDDSRAQVVAEGVGTFAPGSGQYRLYRPGPYPELVGRQVQVTGSVTGRVRWDMGSELAFDPAAPTAPLFATGLVGGLPAGSAVAVAVDGRVAGTSETFRWNGRDGVFGVLLPPGLLRRGPNDVELLVVGSDGSLSRLASG